MQKCLQTSVKHAKTLQALELQWSCQFELTHLLSGFLWPFWLQCVPQTLRWVYTLQLQVLRKHQSAWPNLVVWVGGLVLAKLGFSWENITSSAWFFRKMTRSNIQHPTGIQPHSSLFTNSSASRPRNFRNSWERFGLCSVPCLALVSYNSSGSSTHTCSEDLLTVHCAVRCAFGSQIRAFMNPAWTQHGHRTAFYESSMYPASIKLFLLFFDSHFAARGCGNDMTSFQLSFGNKMRWSIAGMTSV